MAETRHPLYLIPALLFLIPVNIYTLGSGLGAGIQWALFRCQVTSGGVSHFSYTQDICLVVTQAIAGKSGIALALWALSTLLLIGYFIVTVWAVTTGNTEVLRKNALTLIVCGTLFLVSDLVQYGFFLNGPGGFCIPVGIPLFFVLGIWGYSYGFSTDSKPGRVAQKKRLKKPEDIISRLQSWSGLQLSGEVVTLVLISFIVRVIAFFSGLLPNLPLSVILGDTKLYYWYATSVTWGQVPYSSYYVPYPQFFFIPLFIALIPALLVKAYTVYLFSFATLMIIVDTANLVLVYLIAGKLWDKDRAFLCGLLYATAVSAAFFIPITYDALPSFFLLLSLLLYLNRSQVAGYLLATAGVLTKWFPFFAFPYYLLHGLKTGKQWRDFRKPLLLSGILVLITVLPFFLINAEGALKTYTVHFGRVAEVNSSICYLDTICTALTGLALFQSLSLLLVIIGELALLYWYYRSPGLRPHALIGCIFLSIFVFVIFNKVFSTNYIIWLTPFFALFLSGNVRHILLFYAVQAVMYLETPVLFGIVYAPFNLGYDAVTSYRVLNDSFPSLAFLFYTLKFSLLALVFWVIARDIRRNVLIAEPEQSSLPA